MAGADGAPHIGKVDYAKTVEMSHTGGTDAAGDAGGRRGTAGGSEGGGCQERARAVHGR